MQLGLTLLAHLPEQMGTLVTFQLLDMNIEIHHTKKKQYLPPFQI